MQSTSVQDQPQAKATSAIHPESVTSHDTPPPVVFEAGSFLVQKEREYLASEIVTTGTRRRHHISATTLGMNKIYPHYIKVADGSGHVLYDSGITAVKDCVIVFTLTDGDTVTAGASTVSGVTQTFCIDAADARPFAKTADKPSKKRQAKYELGGATEPSIESVKIMKGMTPLYSATLSTLRYGGAEFKILLWLEESK